MSEAIIERAEVLVFAAGVYCGESRYSKATTPSFTVLLT